MSDLTSIKYNNLEFTTQDLFKLEEIERSSLKTENEKFLCEIVDKLFYRCAQLKDQIDHLSHRLEIAIT